MSGFVGEHALDEAVHMAVRADNEGAVVVGWVMVCAFQTPATAGENKTGYAFFAPDGQAAYSTVGMLSVVGDLINADIFMED